MLKNHNIIASGMRAQGKAVAAMTAIALTCGALFPASATANEFFNRLSYGDYRPADVLDNQDPGTHLGDVGGSGYSDSLHLIGPWVLYSSVSAGTIYDDNILLNETGEESDIIYHTRPAVGIASDWDRHGLELFASYDAYNYDDNSSENYEDWETSGRLTLDVYEGFEFQSGFSVDKIHTNRLTLVETLQEPRIEVSEKNYYGQIGYALEGAPIVGRIKYQHKEKDFEPTPLLDLSTRNRIEQRTEVLAEYYLSPDVALTLQPAFTDVHFDNQPAGSTSRDSFIYEFMAGVKVEREALWKANLAVGLISFDRRDSTLKDRDSWLLAAHFLWTPWTHASLRTKIFRNVLVADYRGATEATQTGINLTGIYRINDPLSLQLHTAFDTVEFDGITREDDNFSMGLGGEYIFNDHARLQSSYSFITRDSSQPNQSFDNNVVQLNLQFEL